MPMGLWERFREGLRRTRDTIAGGVGAALGVSGPVDAATLERLEEALLAADVGPATTDELIARARRRMGESRELDLRGALERSAAELLAARAEFGPPPGQRPWVALIIGVNGAGKTTLAGKLAAHFARAGEPTLLVAADTFRAAASEQLVVWAERAGVGIVRAADGADPAAVVHDGLTAALARNCSVVLVDTAGRLHTRQNLMAELEKVRRVCGRVIPGAPHHTLLVLDGTQGLNALAQAREFGRVVPLTSLAVTKLDGTSRGGALLAIADQLRIPVSVVGLGEGPDDWEPFDAASYARGLFETA
ncbi:MAG TPA: signal recognition particle-docking protein FtsY [Candidatus Acidoferrales bacterium]|nr:signal recognition particle-docking protein FtsY [Candidatus Acidoferrales bacterium]